MQTFLPYENFDETARVLDSPRLGNQCYREAVTLIRGGWQHHPASKMWRGHEYYLACYGLALALEMHRRGGWQVVVVGRWVSFWDEMVERHALASASSYPPWLGDEAFHLAHRSNLVRKDPTHYRQFWPDVPDDLPYIWPSAAGAG